MTKGIVRPCATVHILSVMTAFFSIFIKNNLFSFAFENSDMSSPKRYILIVLFSILELTCSFTVCDLIKCDSKVQVAVSLGS